MISGRPSGTSLAPPAPRRPATDRMPACIAACERKLACTLQASLDWATLNTCWTGTEGASLDAAGEC